MAQIVVPLQTESTIGFAALLASIFEHEYRIKLSILSTPTDISKDKPVLVICPNFSRIATDINNAAGHIAGIPDHLVAVVIIHTKAEHSLPTQKTSDVVEDEQCTKFGLLVDFGYLDGHLHDCKMNTEGLKTLHSFLRNTLRGLPSHETVAATATYRYSDEHPRQAALPESEIQFYSDPAFTKFIHHQLNFTGEIQIVRSMADFRNEKMWIAVCNAGSFEETHFRSFSQNAKILVLFDKQLPGDYHQEQNANMLVIRLNREFDERIRARIQADVLSFAEAFMKKDVLEIFKESEQRIEVYTDYEMSQDVIYENLGIRTRMVLSLPDLTKLDSRIIWVLVCRNDSPFIKNVCEASPAIPKMILALDENTKGKIKFELKEFLLIGRLHPSALPLNDIQKEEMRENIIQLMQNVHTRLLKDPLKKLLLKPKSVKKPKMSHQNDNQTSNSRPITYFCSIN